MGFAGRGALAFLLTLLNVRLGRWLPNPALRKDPERWRHNSPPFSASWYLRELLGKHHRAILMGLRLRRWTLREHRPVRARAPPLRLDRQRRRGGRSVGGASATWAMTVRKCRIDFGVDIHIDTDRLRVWIRNRAGSEHGCAIGTIDYPDGPGGELRFQGQIIYIKPVLPKSLKASGAAAGGRQSDLVPADASPTGAAIPSSSRPSTSGTADRQPESYAGDSLLLLAGVAATLKEGQRYLRRHRLARADERDRQWCGASAETSRVARARSPRTARGPALGRSPGPGDDRLHRRRYRRPIRPGTLLANPSARWRPGPSGRDDALLRRHREYDWALGYLHGVGAIAARPRP